MKYTTRPGLKMLLGVALATAPACSGAIGGGEHEDPGGMPGPVPGTNGNNKGTTTGGPAGTATPGNPTPGGPVTPAVVPPGTTIPSVPGVPPVAATMVNAGPMPLRRLTRREYNNTVRDLIGDTTRPADQFPDDGDGRFLFHQAGLVSLQDATLIRSAAEVLSATAQKNLKPLLPCDPVAAGEAACAKQFIDTFGLRAYRRPVAAAESERLLALYNVGRNTLKLAFADTIGLVIEAMLQAPEFLYHWEIPAGPALREGQLIKLGPYELASRLSYFLVGTMPDKELFDAAAANKLQIPADIEKQARRLVVDARAKETLTTFFEEWLSLDELRERPKDPKIYPEYNDALKTAMLEETRAFVQNVVFEGDGKLSTLLTASQSFVNQPLGGLYAMTSIKGAALQKTELNPAQRRGFMTLSGFLTLTGASNGSHPVRRGVEIFQRLLCREIPPPPADVPAAKPASAGGTTRDRFNEHGQNACAKGCHALFDPLGFAFEHYDGLGKHRVMDNMRPVDASGTVSLDGQGQSFTNAIDLTTIFSKSEEVRQCFATQWLRFGLGRKETKADAPALALGVQGLARGDGSLRDLLVALTLSPSFRYRSPTPGEVLP